MADEKDLNAGWRTTKSIPEDATEFEANGRRYRVSRSISFDRYEAYEMLQVEIGMARTFEQFTAQVQEAYDLCNAVATGKPVFADLAVLLRDMRIGTTLIGERQTPAILKLCALFINREGEDVRVVDDEVIEDKINDWRVEGLDMRFFFCVCPAFYTRLLRGLKSRFPRYFTGGRSAPAQRQHFEARIQQIRHLNYGLLTTLSEGRAGDMSVWRGMDVHDFFYALWSHEEYLKERLKPLKEKQHGQGPAGVRGNRGAPG